MPFFARVAAMLAVLLCFAQAAFASDIMTMNATARASLTPMAKTGAVYLALMNHGGVDDRLISVTTPAAASAQIHETTMDGDVMKMREVEGGLLIPAGETIELKPGGRHIMLVGLKAPLKKGETVVLELSFEKAGVVKVDAPVGDVGTGHEHGG